MKSLFKYVWQGCVTAPSCTPAMQLSSTILYVQAELHPMQMLQQALYTWGTHDMRGRQDWPLPMGCMQHELELPFCNVCIVLTVTFFYIVFQRVPSSRAWRPRGTLCTSRATRWPSLAFAINSVALTDGCQISFSIHVAARFIVCYKIYIMSFFHYRTPNCVHGCSWAIWFPFGFLFWS